MKSCAELVWTSSHSESERGLGRQKGVRMRSPQRSVFALAVVFGCPSAGVMQLSGSGGPPVGLAPDRKAPAARPPESSGNTTPGAPSTGA